MKGYEHANGLALDLWETVYPEVLHLALTDTFSTEAFYKVDTPRQLSSSAQDSHRLCQQDFVLHQERAERWSGLRQDSGDPMVYAPRAIEVYESLGIDYRKKAIIYSDSVDVDKALKIQKQCNELGVSCTQSLSRRETPGKRYDTETNFLTIIGTFGIGTSLTNDFKTLSSGGKEKSKALNMVIKLASVDGKPCVKISDELTKVMWLKWR